MQQQKLEAEKLRADEIEKQRQSWENLAIETDEQFAQYKIKAQEENDKYRKAFEALTSDQQAKTKQKIESATIELSESDTRILIDQQLMDSGWEADTVNLRYAKGARPIKGKNRAIAEWPTASGHADYVLFIGLTPIATIEAKRRNRNVYDCIDQAKRYARDFKEDATLEMSKQHNEYKVPLVFSTNGRPYLKQIEQESGTWFLDVRDHTNRRRALKEGWYSPQELKQYLKQTPQKANHVLENMRFEYYQLKLRDYQIKAIQSVEYAIKEGKDCALIAMATGTGKTKTAIAMVYRFLKAQRFRRILFLVDRCALGVQATESFSEVRLDNANTFAETFGIMGIDRHKQKFKKPEDDTKVHITTVQGLARRIIYPKDGEQKPGIGEYDCIIVDECHRGYLLDKEMSEVELSFRDQEDYQSKYTRVIDYFDAFKIGLTATPAPHTNEIFGAPIFTYSYSEAVLDGYLCDYHPPINMITELSENGIQYKVGDEVKVYDREKSVVELYKTPDEIDFEVDDFNKKIVVPEHTKAIAKFLIEEDKIDPYSNKKTLIFCVDNKHADDVVEALREVAENYHGKISDDAIQKITGSSDQPLEKIKKYKNDRLPNIAVTVDLLTTGIDVPEICNLVFLRRINSRILYEQMIGRATRLCANIGKDLFYIYDAVGIYEKLAPLSSMPYQAAKVKASFVELEQEIKQTVAPELQLLAKTQFIAKLQAKKHHLSPWHITQFEHLAGQSVSDFLHALKQMSIEQSAQWFDDHPGVSMILDKKLEGTIKKQGVYIHDGEDHFAKITVGYGNGQKPEDYLIGFKNYVKANVNNNMAMRIIVQKPWQLKRSDLKALLLELEHHHFRERDLQSAFSEVTQVEITSRIIGLIRQAALGEALIPWEERVDKALDKILTMHAWGTPQRNLLELIAKQMKANTIVDVESLDQGIFKEQQGGFQRVNKLFKEPMINDVIEQFNKALWQ